MRIIYNGGFASALPVVYYNGSVNGITASAGYLTFPIVFPATFSS